MIGDEIKQRRTEIGITQAELAARTGVRQSRIAEYESGRRPPTLDALERLADALGPFTIGQTGGSETPQNFGDPMNERIKEMVANFSPVVKASVTSAAATDIVDQMSYDDIDGILAAGSAEAWRKGLSDWDDAARWDMDLLIEEIYEVCLGRGPETRVVTQD